MAEETKDPAGENLETGKDDKGKGDKGKGDTGKTLTLEEVAAQNKELSDKMEKVLKQNSDKDSFITKITNENKDLRDTLQKLSGALSGKTEKQKDAFLDGQRQKFLDKGYDEETVDLLLETVDAIADKKADKKIAAVIMDATEGLIESDPEIDQDFIEKNEVDIKAEFDTYKPETSPRKIKANLKKAYNAVKERLTEKAKTTQKTKEEEEREAALLGASGPQKGKKAEGEDDLVTKIEGAGVANSHFI